MRVGKDPAPRAPLTDMDENAAHILLCLPIIHSSSGRKGCDRFSELHMSEKLNPTTIKPHTCGHGSGLQDRSDLRRTASACVFAPLLQ
jgi:hypothetical protein